MGVCVCVCVGTTSVRSAQMGLPFLAPGFPSAKASGTARTEIRRAGPWVGLSTRFLCLSPGSPVFLAWGVAAPPLPASAWLIRAAHCSALLTLRSLAPDASAPFSRRRRFLDVGLPFSAVGAPAAPPFFAFFLCRAATLFPPFAGAFRLRLAFVLRLASRVVFLSRKSSSMPYMS